MSGLSLWDRLSVWAQVTWSVALLRSAIWLVGDGEASWRRRLAVWLVRRMPAAARWAILTSVASRLTAEEFERVADELRVD